MECVTGGAGVCGGKRVIQIRFRAGSRVEIWPGFFGMLALWWELSGAGEMAAVAMLGAVALHEGGHLLCFWRAGIPVREVVLDFRGVTIRPGVGLYGWKKTLLAVSGGWYMQHRRGGGGLAAGAAGHLVAGVGAAAAVYSLLPLPGTDGWEMVRMLLRIRDAGC